MTDYEILAKGSAFLDELDRRDKHRWAVKFVEADLRRIRAQPKPVRAASPPARAVLADVGGKVLSLARREFGAPIAALERRVSKLEAR